MQKKNLKIWFVILILIFGIFFFVRANEITICIQYPNYKECELNGVKSLEVHEYRYKDKNNNWKDYQENIQLKIQDKKVKIELTDKFKFTLDIIPTLNGVDSTWKKINEKYPDILFEIPKQNYKEGKIKFDFNLTNGGLMGENIPSDVGLTLRLEDKIDFTDNNIQVLNDGILLFNEFKLWLPEGCADISKNEIIYTTLNYTCLDPSLEVGSSITLGGNHEYDTLLVHANGTITLNESYLNITATSWIKIYGTISGSLVGGGSGTGGNPTNPNCPTNLGGGGGGGHVNSGGAGGAGGTGTGGTGGSAYGDNNLNTYYSGSSGGQSQATSCDWQTAGRGGGRIALRSPTIFINGSISSSGEGGYDATGGASGGTILIVGSDLTLNSSTLSVVGGTGGNALSAQTIGGGGGGGSGGRIKIFYENTFLNGSITTNVGGGAGGSALGGGVAGSSGGTGSYYVNQTLDLGFAITPITTLISPGNNTDSSSEKTFNCSATTGTGTGTNLVNMTIFIYNSTSLFNETTNSLTGTSNSTTFDLTFPTTDTYLWNCRASNENQSDFYDVNWTLNVDVDNPAIVLNYPTDNLFLNNGTNIYFNYTPSHATQTVETCQLYGNWSGWHLNQSDSSITEDIVNSFINNLSDGSYLWNVWCNTSETGNSAFSISNYTLTIDTINPNLTIVQPTGAKTSRTIAIDLTFNDSSPLSYCYYNITRGASTEVANTELNCSNPDTSVIVSSDADYIIHVWINDSAGNTDYSNSSFSVDTSTTPVSTSTGGGGVSIVEILADITPSMVCAELYPSFEIAWETFKANKTWENFKIVWFAYFNYVFCESSASIIPI